MKPRYLIIAAGIIAVGVAAWRIHTHEESSPPHTQAASRPPELTVDTISVGRQAVPLLFQANGRAQTRHRVTVRAQVGGVLNQVLFEEGDRVEAGQRLFVIDPRPYEIQVAQAQAKVEQDKAQLAADQASAKRMSQLTGKSYVSKQDYQNAKAQVKQDKAILAADRAQLETARMQLGYTKIDAPISGRTGEIAYKAGNLIDANGSTALVTINQISPIEVQFDLPQARLPALLRYRGQGALKAAVDDDAGNTIATDGKLVFVDNMVNQTTGTLSLKALFPNKNRTIWPGELLTVRLTLTVEHNAIVVPIVAVQPGQSGSYVYTVEHGIVEVRGIDVERQFQGLAVVGDGLAPGDIVVVRVPRELHQGLTVKTHELTLAEATPDMEQI